MKLLLPLIVFAFVGAGTVFAEKLLLTPDMVVNLSGARPASELIDEQNLAGDPLAGKGGQPKTVFSQGWQNKELYYPLDIVVDLGRPHKIAGVCYFDANRSGLLTVSVGSPKAWKEVVSDDLREYLKWKTHRLAEEARYLKITFETPASAISEIVVYGEATGIVHPSNGTAQIRPKPVTIDRFMGMNAFVDDPIERIAAVGMIREYHQWAWDEGNQDKSYTGFPDNRYAWSPSWVSGPGWGWDFDEFYRELRAAGIEIAPVLQQSAPYLVDHDFGRISEKPVSEDEDATRPESYREHADWMFQFAARYGATKVEPALLKLREGQAAKSGLGLIRHLENCNEPDRWWHGRKGHFKPFELAAMCSADFDGDQGRLGDAAVRVYTFRSIDSSRRAFAVWCPTSDDRHVKGFQLNAGAASKVSLISLADKEPAGIRTPLRLTNGLVSIDVSERPVFVVIGEP